MPSIPVAIFTCFLTSTYLSLPISFHLSKIDIPPPWPITGIHFYTGNHFCVLQMYLKNLGVRHYCQLRVAGKLLCKLASFTPLTEDLQDLAQQDGSPGLQPSLSWVYDTTVQSPFSLIWHGKGTSTWISMCFDINTPRSAFPTNNVVPPSRSCKFREAVSKLRLAFHILVQKLDEHFRPFRMPANRGGLYW